MTYFPMPYLNASRVAYLDELIARCDDGTGSLGFVLFRRPGDGSWAAEARARDGKWELLGVGETPDEALADLADRWEISDERAGPPVDPWEPLRGLDALEQRRRQGDA